MPRYISIYILFDIYFFLPEKKKFEFYTLYMRH
jgi:hypothetical protein